LAPSGRAPVPARPGSVHTNGLAVVEVHFLARALWGTSQAVEGKSGGCAVLWDEATRQPVCDTLRARVTIAT